MGGDDLDGDEDYLIESGDVGSVSSSEGKKRKIEDDEEETTAQEQSKKKRKKPRTTEQTLLDDGRVIDQKKQEDQLAFLLNSLNHYNLLAKNEKVEDGLLKMNHIRMSSQETLVDRIRDAVSLKKLKNWRDKSPRVVIVCISARRAVAVLKDLSPLKLRMAKLFPKNGSVEEQEKFLASHTFPFAVGTPHRLATLAESGALSLDRTELVVLDCHVSNKMYTVYTLPDTAPHCMRLLNEFVVPQLKKRKDAQVAFF